MEIKIETIPQKETKNTEAFEAIAKAFNSMEIGQSFVILDSEVKSTTLVSRVKDFVIIKSAEHLKLSRINSKSEDGSKKVIGIRLCKIAATAPRKENPKGENQAPEQSSR